MDIFSFEKLNAYQEARKLVVDIYKIVNELPSEEKFGLGAQLRRASISITSNIAEGCGRISYKEKIHFLEISYGSLLEAYSQIQLSVDLAFTDPYDLDLIRPKFNFVGYLITALRKSYQDILNSDNSKDGN